MPPDSDGRTDGAAPSVAKSVAAEGTVPRRRLPPLTLLLGLLWAAEIVLIVFPEWSARGVVAWGLGIYLIIALPNAGNAARAVGLGLFALAAVSMAIAGRWSSLAAGLESALIFAALLPTLQLARATARLNATVRTTETRLAALPDRQRDIGILFGAHLFGAVLNTGGFAMMAATVREDAPDKARLSNALSALRGLNTAVFWSPFFVGAAVAEHYVPDVHLWEIVPYGIGLAAVALTLSALFFSGGASLGQIGGIAFSLKPVGWLLVLTGGLVGLMSAGLHLPTLEAVSLILPPLCVVQWLLAPESALPVWRETVASMKRMPDDLLLVASAFTLGQALEANPDQLQFIATLLGAHANAFVMLGALIGSTIVLGVVGIHPIVPITLMLIAFGSLPHVLNHHVTMLGILCAWGLGTMNSISSLTVLVAATMFRVPRMRLILGPNLLFVGVFGAIAVAILAVVNAWLGGA